jgi:hypothetical protein
MNQDNFYHFVFSLVSRSRQPKSLAAFTVAVSVFLSLFVWSMFEFTTSQNLVLWLGLLSVIGINFLAVYLELSNGR